MRDLPELGHRGPELGDALVDQAVDVDRAVVEVPLGEPQLHAQRDQSLLRAVVQVALEPTPLLVARAQQPGPARLGLGERVGDLDAQANHLHKGRAAGRDLAEQLDRRRPGVGHQHAVLLVDQLHRHPAAADRLAVGVEVELRPRHPEADP